MALGEQLRSAQKQSASQVEQIWQLQDDLKKARAAGSAEVPVSSRAAAEESNDDTQSVASVKKTKPTPKKAAAPKRKTLANQKNPSQKSIGGRGASKEAKSPGLP